MKEMTNRNDLCAFAVLELFAKDHVRQGQHYPMKIRRRTTQRTSEDRDTISPPTHISRKFQPIHTNIAFSSSHNHGDQPLYNNRLHTSHLILQRSPENNAQNLPTTSNKTAGVKPPNLLLAELHFSVKHTKTSYGTSQSNVSSASSRS